jgi:site-specific DNA-methyltransferase (adenine-specific)
VTSPVRPDLTLPWSVIEGDCLDVMRSLPDGCVDAVVTDPPYGIEGTWDGGKTNGWGKFTGEAKSWDSRPDWIASVIPTIAPKAVVWGGQYFALPTSGSWFIWDKIVRQFSSGHAELAWTNLRKPIRAFSYSHGALATEGKEHPTQKPVPLMRWCIMHLDLEPDSLIIDPFCGSGSTGVAAVQMGYRFLGIEREPAYVAIARRRIADAAAQTRLAL